MRKIVSVISLQLIFISTMIPQVSMDMNDANYEKNNEYAYSLGKGISFNFDDTSHVFRIGGMTQFRYLNSRSDDTLISPSNFIGIKRSFFSFSGELNNNMFSFLVQTNFSESFPLLDAWVGYHPNKYLLSLIHI